MEGLSLVLGLSYGGPAFHDVVTGEVALAASKDYPSLKAWRWMTVVHELAHAKGFTREMDAEILTHLALKELTHPLGLHLANWMALLKTQRRLVLPQALALEFKKVRQQRESLQQPWVDLIKGFLQSIRLQNDGAKYGSIVANGLPPEGHEFFKVVLFEQASL
jgi:hypothetical protein